MPDRNVYLQYKRDTNRLIYWIIHTSNRLWDTDKAAEPSLLVKPTSPQLTLSAILSLTKLIAASGATVPTSIYCLFESAIAARKRAYDFFQNIVTGKFDSETEESNRRHKAFIETLTEAFTLLGGGRWREGVGATGVESYAEEEDDIAFVNKYANLQLKEDTNLKEHEEEYDEGGRYEGKENQAHKRGKTKKGKKGKGKGAMKKTHILPPEPTFQDLPLESYRIVDEQSTVTDYLLAVYAIIQEITDLRSYTQGLWQKVVQGKLNSAAAGAMCNMAVAIIKQLQFEIASDFPGNGSFDAILNAITRGDPDKAQGMFHLGLWRVSPSGEIDAAEQVDIDVKECFMVHAYWDLLAFIQDFRKNRTGKPTKGMLARLNAWNPNFDLKSASRTKRTEWRTAYTINWLYDLVLVWSSIVLQRKNGTTTGTPQHFVLENEDWSAEGKWGEHRRLWGPVDFAADITALAMSKESTDVKSRLLPHHVFQMQCIVDSFAISRGWSYNPLRGHVLSTPPSYNPLQDIKHFQDRPNRGINHSIGLLLGVFEHDAIQQEDSSRHKWQAQILPMIQEDLNIWLGSSKLAYGLNSLPPSRFAKSNSNGLWEYSPYLCGTGLADALEHVYNYGMLTWDRRPEPTAILHLYNMLRQTGNITRPIEVFEQCLDFFGETLFVGGKRPTKDFLQSWKATCGMLDVMGRSMQRRTPRKTAVGCTNTNSKDIISSTQKHIFKRKSLLALLKATNWRPDKIADADLPTFSFLNAMRLMEKEKSQGRMGRNSSRSKVLTAREKLSGLESMPPSPNEDMSSLLGFQNSVKLGQTAEIPPELETRLKASMGIPEDYKMAMGPANAQGNIYGNNGPLQLNNRRFLEVVQRDVVGDIYGNICPLSAISYLHLLAVFMVVFADIEKEGRQFSLIRNATSSGLKEPRVMLVTSAMISMDPDVLAFMGQRMMAMAGGFGCGEFSYFPRFVSIWNFDEANEAGSDKYEGDTVPDAGEQCSLM